MTPYRGINFSLPFLPATPSSLSRPLEGLFELTRHPRLASCIAFGFTKTQGHRQVCPAKHKGPRTLSKIDHKNPGLCVCD